MRLSGKQVGQIQSALLDAFSSKDALRMMVRLELDEHLDEIAGGDNLRVVVFQLVNWAEQTGRESSLIQGAYRQNKGNPKLQQLVTDAGAWFPAPDPTLGSGAAGGPSAAATGAPVAIDVFLSYSRKDSDAMRQVQEDLRSAGLVVWIDEELEAGTQSWKASIQEAISTAQAMVVLLSPAAKASDWVNNEVGYAQTLDKRIFHVLVAGDAASAVPISLINAQWVDGRKNLHQAVTERLLPALRRQDAPSEPTIAKPSQPARVAVPRRRLYLRAGLAVVVLVVGALGLYFSQPYFGPARMIVAGVSQQDPGAAAPTEKPTSKPAPMDTPVPDLNNGTAYKDRAYTYASQGEYDKAIVDYTRAISLDYHDTQSINDRGNAYYALGMYDKAIADYTNALTLDPGGPTAYNNRGLVYFVLGEYDKAIADFTKTLSLGPDWFTAHYYRGVAYKHQNDRDKATADFQRYLDLGSDDSLRQEAEAFLRELQP